MKRWTFVPQEPYGSMEQDDMDGEYVRVEAHEAELARVREELGASEWFNMRQRYNEAIEAIHDLTIERDALREQLDEERITVSEHQDELTAWREERDVLHQKAQTLRERVRELIDKWHAVWKAFPTSQDKVLHSYGMGRCHVAGEFADDLRALLAKAEDE